MKGEWGMEKHRIFIVEDDRKIAQLLADTLRKYQYDVAIIEDFDRVTEECLAFAPHLILLDINLPAYDGYYWCRQLRRPYDVPDYIYLRAFGGYGPSICLGEWRR